MGDCGCAPFVAEAVQMMRQLQAQMMPGVGQGYTPFGAQGMRQFGLIRAFSRTRASAGGQQTQEQIPTQGVYIEFPRDNPAGFEVSYDNGTTWIPAIPGTLVPAPGRLLIRDNDAITGDTALFWVWDRDAGLVRAAMAGLDQSWEVIATNTALGTATVQAISNRDLSQYNRLRVSLAGAANYLTTTASGRLALIFTELDELGTSLQSPSNVTGADLICDTGAIFDASSHTPILMLECGNGTGEVTSAPNTTRTYTRRSRPAPKRGGVSLVQVNVTANAGAIVLLGARF